MLALYLRIRNYLAREEGQDLIEYAILLAILAVALIAVLPSISAWVTNQFTTLEGELDTVTLN